MTLAAQELEINTKIPDNLPPMLKSYLEYKSRYADCLLLFQVGDFYEAFFEDARLLAKTLNVTLTSRDKNSPEPIPMAGVPIAVVEGYVNRLVAVGISVALVSQVTGAESGAAIERRLERIITPGINLGSKESVNGTANYLATLFYERQDNTTSEIALAYSNICSAKISVKTFQSFEAAVEQLNKIAPSELILPDYIDGQKIDRRLPWVQKLNLSLTATTIKYRNVDVLAAASDSQRLSKIAGYSVLAPPVKKAVRLLVQFVDEVTVSADLPFSAITNSVEDGYLSMDATTRRNLELVKNCKDNSESGTLFSAINRTVSASGARTLRDWLLQPLTDIKLINQRLDVVEFLKSQQQLRRDLQAGLKQLSDLERSAARIELAIILPYELAATRASLIAARQVIALLEASINDDLVLLTNLAQQLEFPEQLLTNLVNSLSEHIPISNYAGKIFSTGFDAELDRLSQLKNSSAAWMIQLETREKENTGINSLKVKHNNVHGYFIEVTKSNLSRIPDYYTRKQTTVNGERFIIPELKEMEQQLYAADGKLIEREQLLYNNLVTELKQYSFTLRTVHAALAALDVLCSLAELASDLDLVRPVIDSSKSLHIKSGKHPVLMQILGNRLIANSLELNEHNFCAIITGANMGGKSTYLRQAALLVVLGQMGSFVPAEQAVFGIVDKLFARLGASDDLQEGESTFMVEMREAANIVCNASGNSLVLIDEIGRGTATADGLAIARAILEWIVTRLTCRTLFATHFHELTQLENELGAIQNLSVVTVEEGNNFLFTHEIKHGAADRSYGIEVAKLAGLPAALIKRAGTILDNINSAEAPKKDKRQLGLFDKSISIEPPLAASIFDAEPETTKLPIMTASQQAAVQKVIDTDLDQITALTALVLLAEVKKMLK